MINPEPATNSDTPAPVTARRGGTTERRGELHAALVAAAVAIIESQGIGAVKARGLAVAVGCSVGAIYNVVPDLDALLLEVNASTLEAIDAALTAASARMAAEASPEARMVSLGLAYLDYAAAHPSRWSALFAHRMSDGNPVPAWYLSQQATMFTHVEAPLAALRPELDAAANALLARSLFSAVHGLVSLGLSGTLVSLPLGVLKTQLETIVAAMARGLAPRET